jgi:hypothetical protein
VFPCVCVFVYFMATASVCNDLLVNTSRGRPSTVEYTAFPSVLFTILPNALAWLTVYAVLLQNAVEGGVEYIRPSQDGDRRQAEDFGVP